MNDTERQELAARVKVAGMVTSRLLENGPDDALIHQLSDPVMLDAWPLSDKASLQGVDVLRRVDGADEQWDDPVRDHLYLIRGIGRPLVEPHESARLSREHLVFEEETAQVRHAYALAGFRITKLHQEPDDHIAYQVAFVTELMGRISTHVGTPEADRWARVADAFTQQHLDRFFDDVCDGLQANARSRIYTALPLLLRGWRAEAQRVIGG